MRFWFVFKLSYFVKLLWFLMGIKNILFSRKYNFPYFGQELISMEASLGCKKLSFDSKVMIGYKSKAVKSSEASNNLIFIFFWGFFYLNCFGVVHLLRLLFRGEGGLRFCNRSNKEKFFSYKICNKGEGGLKFCFFLRNLISERPHWMYKWIVYYHVYYNLSP